MIPRTLGLALLLSACASAPVRTAPPATAAPAEAPLRAQVEPVAEAIAKALGGRAGRIGVVAPASEPGDEITGVLAEHLQNALLRSKLRVVERARLADAMKELRIAAGDLFDAGAAPRAGKLLGIDLLVTTVLAPDDGDWRWHVRVVEVASGALRYSGSFTLEPSDELRRLSGEPLPGTLVVHAPTGTPVRIGARSFVVESDSLSVALPAGTHAVEVELDGVAASTKVQVPERGTAELRPQVVRKSTFDSNFIFKNALIPGLTSFDPHGVWVLLPAAGFYASLAATLYDGSNRPNGFLTAEQQRASDQAYRADMVYDYAALGGFYALTLAGAAVQASQNSKSSTRIQWTLSPRLHEKGGALAFAMVF